MGSPALEPYVDYATYLALERESDAKLEWYDGQVYAMAGGTPTHARLAAQVAVELGLLTRGGPCGVYSSDGKVRVRATGRATYPDLSVVCGPVERDPEDPNAINNPTVVVEVLSPATERDDRGAKFRHYRQLPSLRHYVLVAQDAAWLEVFSRDDAGGWRLVDYEAGGRAELAALGGAVAVDEVYRGVTLETDER